MILKNIDGRRWHVRLKNDILQVCNPKNAASWHILVEKGSRAFQIQTWGKEVRKGLNLKYEVIL